jgi:flagellar basal-body rod protein FlgB
MADLMKAVFDRSIPALEKSLDLAWRRNEAISSNVANAETPGYRAVDLNFAGELERAFEAGGPGQIKKTDAKHMDLVSEGKSFLTPDLSGATRADGNNVDIDAQMGKMVYNQGKYSMGASLIRKKLQMMRTAIRYAAR